jgi:hypothetical protein
VDHDKDTYSARITERVEWESATALVFWFRGPAFSHCHLVFANVSLGDSFRFYAVLTVAGGWVASVLGLRILPRLPLRDY